MQLCEAGLGSKESAADLASAHSQSRDIILWGLTALSAVAPWRCPGLCLWMPALGSSVVGSEIPMPVAERARDMSLPASLPGMSFLLKCQLDLFFVFLSFFFFFLSS